MQSNSTVDELKTAGIQELNENRVFTPKAWNVGDIRKAMPEHVFKRDLRKGLSYLLRDLVMLLAAVGFVWKIDQSLKGECNYTTGCSWRIPTYLIPLGRWMAWSVYWWFQGLIFTGIWVIAHECGHGGLCESKRICDTIGFVLHTGLLVPYYSFKITHHRHHVYHALMEREESWLPPTRSMSKVARRADMRPGDTSYLEHLEDSPVFTLAMLLLQQFAGLMAYFAFNERGNAKYGKGTSHFNPHCMLFTKRQRILVIYSDMAMIGMLLILALAIQKYSFGNVLKYYGIPWLLVNHWVIAITFLQHTDPAIPFYRGGAWSFGRGATATMDRDFLGSSGRFFLHGISHYHIVHHFFPKMPFYHAEEATKHLKTILGDHYLHSDIPVLKALWSNFNSCQFVEDSGSILFYRDKDGIAAVRAVERDEDMHGA